MKKSESAFKPIEFLVGILALTIGFINLFPFKFFGIPTGVQILFLSIIISGMTLLAVGTFKLASAFSNQLEGLTRLITIVTSVLILVTVVIILLFQMIATGQRWLNVLFGISLLSYAIGRIAIGALAGESNSGLRAFIYLMGIIIGVFSITVILFHMVPIISEGSLVAYLTYGYFVNIALILIGVDCIVSAIARMLLKASFRMKT